MITYLEAFPRGSAARGKLDSPIEILFVISANKGTNVSDGDSILTCIFENSVSVVIVVMGFSDHPLLKHVLYWEMSSIV